MNYLKACLIAQYPDESTSEEISQAYDLMIDIEDEDKYLESIGL